MNLDASPISLTELLRCGGIKMRLTNNKRDAILEELVRLIPEISENAEAQNTLLRALKEREQLHSTSIGDGIAIPHARNALIGLVQRPVMIFGRHPEGVNYGGHDSEATKLFFLIVSPTVTHHLAILARLSRLLRNPVLKRDLLAADKSERVLEILRQAETNLK
jgi:mannitol/fructose-specific phosphotransferase system IIA component (Ntr-type)